VRRRGVLLDLALTAILGLADAPLRAQSCVAPRTQVAFARAVESVKSEYAAAPNELRKSAVRTRRGALIRSALGGSRAVTSWVGRLRRMQTNSEGRAMIVVELDGTNGTIETWNNALSDMMDNTLIPQSSPVYSALSDMAVGQTVLFSGSFLRDERDYAREASMTEAGSMSSPNFILRFRSVRRC